MSVPGIDNGVLLRAGGADEHNSLPAANPLSQPRIVPHVESWTAARLFLRVLCVADGGRVYGREIPPIHPPHRIVATSAIRLPKCSRTVS